MKCPVDGETLVKTERMGIEIDYCPVCRGVWLDRGELDKIIQRTLDDEMQKRGGGGYGHGPRRPQSANHQAADPYAPPPGARKSGRYHDPHPYDNHHSGHSGHHGGYHGHHKSHGKYYKPRYKKRKSILGEIFEEIFD